MIEQIGAGVKFVAFFTVEKQGAAGLTVTVDVYDAANTKIVTDAAVQAIGGGLYAYSLAGTQAGAEGLYIAIFKTVGEADQQHIPSLWSVGVAGVERLDADVSSSNAIEPPTVGAMVQAVWDEAIVGHVELGSTGQALSAAGAANNPLLDQVPGSYPSGSAGAALGKIGNGRITTVSPVSQSGSISLIRGDDYSAGDGRALEWVDASSVWPELSGVVTFTCDKVQATGEIITATGSNKKIQFELTAAQTIQLNSLSTKFSVKMVQGDGETITLVQGTCTGN